MNLESVRWRKSSRSSGQGDPDKENCVEVAMTDTAASLLAPNATCAAIRDSKNPGPALVLPQTAWSGLVHRLAL